MERRATSIVCGCFFYPYFSSFAGNMKLAAIPRPKAKTITERLIQVGIL